MVCSQPSSDDFTAYADLNQADVEKWLNDGLDVAALDLTLDNQLEAIINHKIVVLPNPWDSVPKPTPIVVDTVTSSAPIDVVVAP